MDFQEFFRDTWQTSLIFFSLLVLTRLLGKTQVGQLTFYEYISGITIGSIAATVVSSDPDKVWSHFYDLLLFVALTYLISLVTMHSRPLRKLIEGSPTIVIQNGLILEENMGKLRYDLDELRGQLRQQGVFDPSEIQYAILETNGDLSVIKKSDYQPITRSDLNIHTPDPIFPIELIMDGKIIKRNLELKNLSTSWLKQQLAAQNITDESEVTYAGIDSKGQFFINRNIRDNTPPH